jgi:FAD/FMN-containing dehydrogenase/Fe-S oxidoreductase
MVVDEQQRERIRDDLKGLIKGELLFDELSRALYSTDASIFQVEPVGVAVPRDEEDVQALVRYAAEHRLPLVPRGAGTGLAGEALGSGLILDLSQHMRAITAVDTDTVRAQVGVVCRDLNTRLAAVGRRFAPDPASGSQCTVGGMLATDASGARALRHGYTHDHVAALRVVLDNGEAVEVSCSPLPPPESTNGNGAQAAGGRGPSRLEAIIGGTAELLERNADLIRAAQPRTRFDRCGYRLHDVRTPDRLDLTRLLVGSEGTLGLFTEATLRTIPLAEGRALVLLGFASVETAVRAAQVALPSGPAACELLDRRLLSLARSSGGDIGALVPAAAEAVLLIEYESDTPAGARTAATALIDHLQRAERLALYAVAGFEPEEITRLWRVRERAMPSLYGLRGGAQPVPFVEDVAVPPEHLAEFLHRIQEVMQRHETTAAFLVHAGTGQVHARPFLDLRRPEDISKLWAIAEDVHGLALGLGGTVSSQHGTGLARTPWVARQYRRLFPIFREVKEIFDPRHIFNPGKIVGPDPGMPPWPLRRYATMPAEPAAWLLRWQPGEVRAEYTACNGCGSCRTEEPGRRMCPLFRATHAEAATPRAKANLLRHLLRDGPVAHRLSADDVREVADLCVNCKMCAVECPAHVNVPKLMLEAKAANVAEHGLDRASWVLARTESFAALGSTFALLVNGALASPMARWVLEKLFGVSRRRRLPAFASWSFLRRAKRRGWTRLSRSRGPRLAYFVDVFANYNDPLLAEAVVAVLRHHGFAVHVPPDQIGCGMAPLATGDVETAREAAQHNVRLLADLVRDGYLIVCSEPTAALMLRQDYLDLLDDADARLVADHTTELTAFLGELHRQGRLRTDFRPLSGTLGHHVPCHVKALGQPPAGPGLLSLIPDLRVRTIDVSCSGMAGTFGLQAANYRVSLEAGRPMLEELRRPGVLFGSTECSACRLQMEEGSGKRTLHPVQYLALAYGLVPETARLLQEPIRDLVLQ